MWLLTPLIQEENPLVMDPCMRNQEQMLRGQHSNWSQIITGRGRARRTLLEQPFGAGSEAELSGRGQQFPQGAPWWYLAVSLLSTSAGLHYRKKAA